jgi:lysophospholipase L1-like esterase
MTAVAIGIGILAALLVCEALLRALRATESSRIVGGWDFQVFDAVLGWKNKPGYRNDFLEINALSFRGAPLQRRKPAGTVRIACLGDSGTFGIWAKATSYGLCFDSYPDALARLLRRPGTPVVEVINCGVLGYSSSHGLRQLLTSVAELDPDIVTLRFGFNDHSMAWDSTLRMEEPASPLLRLLLYRLWRWQLARLYLWTYRRTLRSDPFLRWTTVERFEANLHRFAEVARRRRWKLLVLDYPLRPIERGESRDTETPFFLLGAADLADLHRLHATYQDALRRVVAAEGLALVETGAAFRACHEEVWSDYDLIHPNDRGAELIARQLVASMEREGWLHPSLAPARG